MFNQFINNISNDKIHNQNLLMEISKNILNNFFLISKFSNKQYFINDIEFYISSKQHNIDIDENNGKQITHCNERQLLFKKWYIHRMGKNENSSLSLIQGAGIDICIGNKEKKMYGGILIRSIIDMKTNSIFYGPQKVVREIFQLQNLYHKNKECFIKYTNIIEQKNIDDINNLLHVQKLSYSLNKQIIADKRINVNNNLLYRFRW